MSNYDALKALVERISGQASIITVLRVYVDICGDLETAAVLSQCVFWSDKGRTGDGWFYKSRDEWRREIGIKRSSLETAVDHLCDLGIVETKLGSGTHNAPTKLYRVNMDKLTHVVAAYLSGRLADFNQSNTRSADSNQSSGLNPANDLADSSQSSYRSLLQRLPQKQDVTPENAAVTLPVWESLLMELRVMWNGQFKRIDPRLIDYADEPATMLVHVKSKTPGLAADLERMLRGIDRSRNWKVELTTEATHD